MFEMLAKHELFALNAVMFCFFGASACLLPYMTIHMRHLGLSVEEVAIVYSILPFVQALGSPLAGLLADKLGNYKPVLVIALIVSILTSLVLMLIPSAGNPQLYQTEEQIDYHRLIYGSYLVIRIVFQIAIGTCQTLLDATAVFLCEKHSASFGRVRFWGILATGLFSPICGWLVDYLSHGLDEYSTNFIPTFLFFNGFLLLTTIATVLLTLEVASESESVWKNLQPILNSITIWILLSVILILGIMWGFVESFLFWYLLDLEAPKFLLGLTLTTGAIVSLPFLHSADWFLAHLGHTNLMIIALVFYFIRYVGYSLIHSPFWCFPFEAMEAFTYHLMWVAATTYAASLTSKGLRATVIGVVGTLHNGIGRAGGSMIGGTLISVFDTRHAFRYLGLGSGLTAILYAGAHFGYLRHQKEPEKSQDDSKDVEADGHIEMNPL